MTALVAFAIASALHAGFQVAVTALVYPVLAGRGPTEWRVVHALHSRSIVPLVVVIYTALVICGGALVVAGPGILGWVALAATAAALTLTAVAAAPLHGRLTDRDDRLVASLLTVDRFRCGLALAGAVLAVAAAVVGG